MKPVTADDVIDIMDGYLVSGALNTAMATGLFWRLAREAQSSDALARATGMPETRCRFLLEMLADQGLVDRSGDLFTPSATARSAILEVYGPSTWKMLAQMAMERLPVVLGLPQAIADPASAWTSQGLDPPSYFIRVAGDAQHAREYGGMLHALHRPLAEAVADALDVGAARSLLDLGGGSGVVSLALLRRHPSLRAVVMDIGNACAAGRELAASEPVADRLAFHAGDFNLDPLPGRFDLVLTCDTGPYSEALFAKIRDALNPGGRLALVEQFPGDAGGPIARPWLGWAFRASLHDPAFRLPAFADVEPLLVAAGLEILAHEALPARQEIRWAKGWSIVLAGDPSIRRARASGAP